MSRDRRHSRCYLELGVADLKLPISKEGKVWLLPNTVNQSCAKHVEFSTAAIRYRWVP
ncbi:unnamed protein product [Prunus armeniaca]|uniref:Uncharacterized protein n=1 Tax=Prunus armeniaca TaxID=36596 RepID=A0A6J5U046_PRUAR|nr:unnamed protein product [Prunus armeniaca]